MGDWFKPEGASRTFNDEQIQQYLADAEDEPDPDARRQLLEQASARAHDQASWVFSHQQFSIYGVNEDVDWDAREDEDVLFEEMSPA